MIKFMYGIDSGYTVRFPDGSEYAIDDEINEERLYRVDTVKETVYRYNSGDMVEMRLAANVDGRIAIGSAPRIRVEVPAGSLVEVPVDVLSYLALHDDNYVRYVPERASGRKTYYKHGYVALWGEYTTVGDTGYLDFDEFMVQVPNSYPRESRLYFLGENIVDVATGFIKFLPLPSGLHYFVVGVRGSTYVDIPDAAIKKFFDKYQVDECEYIPRKEDLKEREESREDISYDARALLSAHYEDVLLKYDHLSGDAYFQAVIPELSKLKVYALGTVREVGEGAMLLNVYGQGCEYRGDVSRYHAGDQCGVVMQDYNVLRVTPVGDLVSWDLLDRPELITSVPSDNVRCVQSQLPLGPDAQADIVLLDVGGEAGNISFAEAELIGLANNDRHRKEILFVMDKISKKVLSGSLLTDTPLVSMLNLLERLL